MFDKNAEYIIACFTLGAIAVVGAGLWSWLKARTAKRRLAQLEAASKQTSDTL